MVSESWRAGWVSDKCTIAGALARGEAGGSYAEAVMLVCAVLTALAAEVWPGRNIDRARFVELLVRRGAQPRAPRTVSVPLLVEELAVQGSEPHATLLRQRFLPFAPTRVVTGRDVDRLEDELSSTCPGIDLRCVRRHSYASLLYSEIRSSYAHDYAPGGKADSWPMTTYRGQFVSYVNRLLNCDTLASARLIHFHVESLIKIAVELAADIDGISLSLPLKRPNAWWIDGAP